MFSIEEVVSENDAYFEDLEQSHNTERIKKLVRRWIKYVEFEEDC